MIIDGPDYIGARFEGQLQPHFNNHCMNIKMRELLFEKMYGGKILNLITMGINFLYFFYFLVIQFIVNLIFAEKFRDIGPYIGRSEMLENVDISIKNKGTKIPKERRTAAIIQFFSRVVNLEDFPKQMSSLFSGNSSRLQHKLFDDLTQNYDGTVSAKDFILNSIKRTSVNKHKQEIGLTLEQENFVLEFHKYAFNIKLGMEVFNISSTIVEIEMTSLEVIKVI